MIDAGNSDQKALASLRSQYNQKHEDLVQALNRLGNMAPSNKEANPAVKRLRRELNELKVSLDEYDPAQPYRISSSLRSELDKLGIDISSIVESKRTVTRLRARQAQLEKRIKNSRPGSSQSKDRIELGEIYEALNPSYSSKESILSVDTSLPRSDRQKAIDEEAERLAKRARKIKVQKLRAESDLYELLVTISNHKDRVDSGNKDALSQLKFEIATLKGLVEQIFECEKSNADIENVVDNLRAEYGDEMFKSRVKTYEDEGIKKERIIKRAGPIGQLVDSFIRNTYKSLTNSLSELDPSKEKPNDKFGVDNIWEGLSFIGKVTGAAITGYTRAYADFYSTLIGNGKIDDSIYESDTATRIAEGASQFLPYVVPGPHQALLFASQIASTERDINKYGGKAVWNQFIESNNPFSDEVTDPVTGLKRKATSDERILRGVNLVFLAYSLGHLSGKVSDAAIVNSLKKHFGLSSPNAKSFLQNVKAGIFNRALDYQAKALMVDMVGKNPKFAKLSVTERMAMIESEIVKDPSLLEVARQMIRNNKVAMTRVYAAASFETLFSQRAVRNSILELQRWAESKEGQSYIQSRTNGKGAWMKSTIIEKDGSSATSPTGHGDRVNGESSSSEDRAAVHALANGNRASSGINSNSGGKTTSTRSPLALGQNVGGSVGTANSGSESLTKVQGPNGTGGTNSSSPPAGAADQRPSDIPQTNRLGSGYESLSGRKALDKSSLFELRQPNGAPSGITFEPGTDGHNLTLSDGSSFRITQPLWHGIFEQGVRPFGSTLFGTSNGFRNPSQTGPLTSAGPQSFPFGNPSEFSRFSDLGDPTKSGAGSGRPTAARGTNVGGQTGTGVQSQADSGGVAVAEAGGATEHQAVTVGGTRLKIEAVPTYPYVKFTRITGPHESTVTPKIGLDDKTAVQLIGGNQGGTGQSGTIGVPEKNPTTPPPTDPTNPAKPGVQGINEMQPAKGYIFDISHPGWRERTLTRIQQTQQMIDGGQYKGWLSDVMNQYVEMLKRSLDTGIPIDGVLDEFPHSEVENNINVYRKKMGLELYPVGWSDAQSQLIKAFREYVNSLPNGTEKNESLLTLRGLEQSQRNLQINPWTNKILRGAFENDYADEMRQDNQFDEPVVNDSKPDVTEAVSSQDGDKYQKLIESVGGTVIATMKNPNYKRGDHTKLVGSTANDFEGISKIAQPLRDPDKEVLYWVFMNGKEVKHVTAYSARMLNATGFFTSTDHQKLTDMIVDTAEQFNATSIYMIHNHPMGIPQPSSPDVNITKMVNNLINQRNEKIASESSLGNPIRTIVFNGHVIINSNKFGVITPSGSTYVQDRIFFEGQDPTLRSMAEIRDQEARNLGSIQGTEGTMIGSYAYSEAQIAEIAKRAQKGDNAVIVSRDYQGRIVGVSTIPLSILRSYAENPVEAIRYENDPSKRRVLAWLADLPRLSGGETFICMTRDQKMKLQRDQNGKFSLSAIINLEKAVKQKFLGNVLFDGEVLVPGKQLNPGVSARGKRAQDVTRRIH